MRALIASRVGLFVLAALVISATIGFLLGRGSVPPSESEIIDRLAAGYAAETGGALTDCAARPGPGEAWLTVFCDGDAGRFAYSVDRYGRALEVEEGV
ncbi:MAG: hypothetical protein AAFN09_08315 [Pseudomonadota bacterium]